MSIKSRVENCIRRLYRRHVEDDIDTVQNQIQKIERRNNMKKKYPSQKKYEAENPAITIRLKKIEKERIMNMAKESGISISEFVRTGLLDQEMDFSNAIAAAEKKGYRQAEYDWALWVVCRKCGYGFHIKPGSDLHKKLREVTDGHFEHTQCPDD